MSWIHKHSFVLVNTFSFNKSKISLIPRFIYIRIIITIKTQNCNNSFFKMFTLETLRKLSFFEYIHKYKLYNYIHMDK